MLTRYYKGIAWVLGFRHATRSATCVHVCRVLQGFRSAQVQAVLFQSELQDQLKLSYHHLTDMCAVSLKTLDYIVGTSGSKKKLAKAAVPK